MIGTDVVTRVLMNTTNSASGTISSLSPAEPLDSLDRVRHAHELLKEFDTVMLLTFDRNQKKMGDQPQLHARPMAVAQVDTDCSLWFVTSIDSSKVDEALTPYDGHAVGQTKSRQVSISGTFTVLRDPDQIALVWKKAYEVWFPKGPTDPRVCLLGLHPREIEFWDESGTKGLKYMIDAAKALVTGTPTKPQPGQHDKVRL